VANDSGASTQGGQGELRWGNCRLTMSEGMPNVVVDDKWGASGKGVSYSPIRLRRTSSLASRS
jgi:hypothetical protein